MNAKINIVLRGMAFLAIVLSFAGRLVADEIEEEAEKTVSFLKGVLVRDEKAAGRPITRIDLSGTAVNGAALRKLGGLRSLHDLNISDTRLADGGVKGLAEFKGLQSLNLGNTQVTDTGLMELNGLDNLRNLLLTNTQVTDKGSWNSRGSTVCRTWVSATRL